MASRDELRAYLVGLGVEITEIVTKKTTHLLLGSENSETRRYSLICKSGTGSTDYAKAESMKIPIVKEVDLWSLITDAATGIPTVDTMTDTISKGNASGILDSVVEKANTSTPKVVTPPQVPTAPLSQPLGLSDDSDFTS